MNGERKILLNRKKMASEGILDMGREEEMWKAKNG